MIKHKHFLPKGFTIVEMLVILSIIGILATILILGYAGYREKVYQTQIITTVDAYSKSLKAYALEYRSYPKESFCVPSGAKCCASHNFDPTSVWCASSAQAVGDHNWQTGADAKVSKYVTNDAPSFPVVASFPDCTSGIMIGPCKPTSSIPAASIAYMSNVTGTPNSNYTSTEPSVKGKGFLIYYIDKKYTCGSKNVMTLTPGQDLVFNSSATYTREASTYRECIVGLRN